MSSKKQLVLGFHNCIDGFYAAYQTDLYLRYLRDNPDYELVLVPLDYPLNPGQYETIRKYAKPGNKFCLVDYALSSERLIKLSKLYDKVVFVDHHPKGFRIAENLRRLAANLIAQGRLVILVDKDRCGSKIFNDEIIQPCLLQKAPDLAAIPRPSLRYIDMLDRGLLSEPNYDQISCFMGVSINMNSLRDSFDAFARIDAMNNEAFVVTEGQKILDTHRPRQAAIRLLKNHYCIWLEGLEEFKDGWYPIVFFNILDPIYGRPLADKACKLSRYQESGVYLIGCIRSGKFHLSVRTWKGLPENSVVTIKGNGHQPYRIDNLSIAPDAGVFARCLAALMKKSYGIPDNASDEDKPEGDGHEGRGCAQSDPILFSRNFFVATQKFAGLYPKGPPAYMVQSNFLGQAMAQIYPSAPNPWQFKQYGQQTLLPFPLQQLRYG